MNPAGWLCLIGIVMMLSIGPWYDRLLVQRPRLNEDAHLIWMGIVWTGGMMLFVLGITSVKV